MSVAVPQQSQYQGPMYIKQLEDVFLPPQPFTERGFAQRGVELQSQVQLRQWNNPRPMVQMPLNREFLPMKANYGFYLANMETGYVDRKETYPQLASGFRCTGF
jgi:hypothetical protein